MKTKKIISRAGLIAALAFTIILLFSVFVTWTNQRHNVEFFSGSNFNGYEQTPPVAQIQISSALAWEHTSTATKVIGFIFLGLLWLAIWFVDNDKHLGKKKPSDPGGDRNGLAAFLILIPLVLSAAFLFGGYSSKYSNNYVSVEKIRFDEWLKTGAVEQRGGKTYIDKADTIKPYFNKKLIN